MSEQLANQNETVKLSHARCIQSQSFLDDFYNSFMGSSQEVRQMFVNTDLEKQKSLLKDGITYLIMYDADNIIGKIALKNIGEIHNRNQKNIEYKFYPIWTKCLLQTVAKHDPKFDDDIKLAWDSVLIRGIDFLKSQY